MNVAQLFDRQAQADPSALALRWDGGQLSYGELRELVVRFAALARARGLGPDDRVAILLPNDPAFAVVLLGTFWSGAVAVVCSPAWAPVDAAGALAGADARLLVTTASLAAAVGAPPESTLTIDDDAGFGALGAALRAAVTGRTGDAPHPRAAGAAASVLFSSGTTGDPKGVVLTHGNLRFNALAKVRYCGISARDRLALVVPMAHCFGQNVVLLGALAGGAAVRIHRRFDAGALLADIAAKEATMVLASPTVFTRLLEGGDAALRSLRYALSAAAPLGDDLAARWHSATGRALAQGYGQTECSPFATYSPAVTGHGRRVGRAIDGVEVRVASTETGDWITDDSPGEIAMRGPNVMAGYWGRPEATAAALRGGWLRTGDIGSLDRSGELTLVDRVDDVINVAGFKAWPSDVERVLLRQSMVEEAAAFALPDASRGSRVAAAIVLRAGILPTDAVRDEIMRCATRELAGYQRPTALRFVERLPRSPSGKVLRKALVADVQDDPMVSPLLPSPAP